MQGVAVAGRLFRGTWRDRTVLALVCGYLVAGAYATGWVARYTWAVWRLQRGVGDTVFFDADGKAWFSLDEHRDDVRLGQISPRIQEAVVAVEDHRFRRHPGIDPIAFARAMLVNLRARAVTQGGSTLTQQLARTLFLSNNRTYGRKAREAVLAVLLEQQLGKDQILELYLNRVYMGSGVYGVEAMSKKLFGRRARDVRVAEAALLAGLVQAPSSLSPWTNLEGAVARSHVVLSRMREEGYIDEETEAAARRATLRLQPRPRSEGTRWAYAKDFLRQQFRDHFGDDHPPDWEVHTTFDPALQDAAEQAVGHGLRRLGIEGLQAALVALDPQNGDVYALVGGSDFQDAPFNRAVRSRRQPGSAFKPVVYAAALEKGFSPASILTGLLEVTAPGAREWTPRNADQGEDAEEMSLRQALLESNNHAAVALQQRIGSRPVLHLAEALGLKDLPDVPSLALGTGLVSPLDLTAAYAVFPNGGLAVRPRGLLSVLDGDGQVAFEDTAQPRRVLRAQTAFQALTMLEDVVERGTGASARTLGVRFPVGGKTGTTDDYKDAWFVGFSSAVVVGVWVGFDQPATIGREAYGARVALPIWADFMRRTAGILRPGDFAPPPGLEERELCRISYLRPVDDCPTYLEYFKEKDVRPERLCPLHRGSLKERARQILEGFWEKMKDKMRDMLP